MLAKALKVIGLINIQFAVQKNVVFILEVNPRASRTVPFVSKAIGVSLANIATQVILGKSSERNRIYKGNHSETHFGQGSGISVRAVRGNRYAAFAGNEKHRRGDGHFG